MKCNNCVTDMKLATQADYGMDRILGLSTFDQATEGWKTIGYVVYCPKCGNLQVDLEKTIELCDQ